MEATLFFLAFIQWLFQSYRGDAIKISPTNAIFPRYNIYNPFSSQPPFLRSSIPPLGTGNEGVTARALDVCVKTSLLLSRINSPIR